MLGAGVGVVIAGWQTCLNQDQQFGAELVSYQLAADIGTGIICSGIAALILGGTSAVLDVLVRTRST